MVKWDLNQRQRHERGSTDLLLCRLTLEAQRRVAASPLSKREAIRLWQRIEDRQWQQTSAGQKSMCAYGPLG
jgi:hypothetical protein